MFIVGFKCFHKLFGKYYTMYGYTAFKFKTLYFMFHFIQSKLSTKFQAVNNNVSRSLFAKILYLPFKLVLIDWKFFNSKSLKVLFDLLYEKSSRPCVGSHKHIIMNNDDEQT